LNIPSLLVTHSHSPAQTKNHNDFMAALARRSSSIAGVVPQDPITPRDDDEANKLALLKVALGDALTIGRHSKYEEVVGDVNLLRHLRGLITVKEAKKKFLAGLEMREKHNLDDIRDEWAPKLDAMGYDLMQKWRNNLIEDWSQSCGGMGGGAGWEEEGWPSRTVSGCMYNCVSIADWQPGSKTEGMLFRNTEEEVRRYQLVDIVVHQMRFDRISRYDGYMAKVCFVWDFNGVTTMFQMQNKEWKRRMDEMDALRGELHIEYLGKFYLINASWIVRKLYSIIRLAIPSRTAAKVVVLGTDWREEVLQEFDPKVVALMLKLSNKSGKPKGSDAANQEQEDLVGTIHLSAGSKKEVVIDLDSALEVTWNFQATSRDINFSAVVTGADGPLTIVEDTRYAASEGNIVGSCPKGSMGILVLCWDNSHSWLRGNGVEYEVVVVSKEEESAGETKEF